MLAQVHDSPQDFKEVLKDGFLLVKVRSYNIFSYKSIGASFAKNARIDEQVAKAREGVCSSLFKRHVVVSVHCYLLNQEQRPLSSCTFR